MFYVYILLCADDKFYVGFTKDLKLRKAHHDNGRILSTKLRLPARVVFYEAYVNKYDALRREKYFKSSKGKTSLRAMLKETLS